MAGMSSGGGGQDVGVDGSRRAGSLCLVIVTKTGNKRSAGHITGASVNRLVVAAIVQGIVRVTVIGKGIGRRLTDIGLGAAILHIGVIDTRFQEADLFGQGDIVGDHCADRSGRIEEGIVIQG